MKRNVYRSARNLQPRSCYATEVCLPDSSRQTSTKENMNPNAKCYDPKAMALALARWCIGIILLIAGISKLSMGPAKFAEMIAGMFEKTWLPKALVLPYGYALPFVELILGVLLILGLFRNAALFVSGLLFISLTFGQMAMAMSGNKDASVTMFQNLVFTFLNSALLFLHEHDRWVIPCGCRKNEGAATTPPVM
jgi:thiosulfate dehydrogenase (quinone) large subunit